VTIVGFWLSVCCVSAPPGVIVVVGAEGTSDHGEQFRAWAVKWQEAAKKAPASIALFGLDAPSDQTDLERLEAALAAEAKESTPALWIVLIGHGTFDGKTARFNLRGPDLSAGRLSELLAPFRRRLALVLCFSASGGFVPSCVGPNRVVIAATKSGHEQNFSRFGGYFAEAIADPMLDYDKDGQVSLLEAFLIASRRVDEFYRTSGRLATEHAIVDDTGDGVAAQASAFEGTRMKPNPKDALAPEGRVASQMVLVESDRERTLPAEIIEKRNVLELAIGRLRDEKDSLAADEYYARLEALLLQLARLYRTARPAPSPPLDALAPK
jgi:hypothetical protein